MSEPCVRTTAGVLVGRLHEDGIHSYLGVSYAAPPVGPLRLQPPRPVEPWTGVRPALRFGPTPPKGRLPPHLERMFPERWIAGDDYLNLNIWTPGPEASAPVLVWIHGGGFTNGSNSAAELDGAAFARSGVVCVTIGYRVAADGFLHLGDGVSNLGLRDQVAALEWIRENIAAFGGDPERVTLAGHSAGGSSVLCLLASTHSRGLYARAISMSTSGVHRLTSPDFAQHVAEVLAARLGVPARREALAEVPVDQFVRATGELMETLQRPDAVAEWGPEVRTMAPWAPTADGSFLPEDALGAIAAGAGSVPLLVGTARDELRLHLTPEYLENVDEEVLLADAARYGLGPDELDVYRTHRPAARPGDLLAAVATDWYFRMPTVRLAEARAQSTAPTWMYRIDRPRTSENAGYGACHASEVPFVFDTVDVAETHVRVGIRPDRGVVAQLHGAWVEFVKGANPAWAPYEPSYRTTGLLTDHVEVADDPDGIERGTWGSFC